MRKIKGVPVYDNGAVRYVKFSEIDTVLGHEKAKQFDEWMTAKTCPIVNKEMVAYVWDFEVWAYMYLGEDDAD